MFSKYTKRFSSHNCILCKIKKFDSETTCRMGVNVYIADLVNYSDNLFVFECSVKK